MSTHRFRFDLAGPAHQGRVAKAVLALALAVSWVLLAVPASAVDTLPILWEAGGQSAGNDGAGQAARIATDTSGNVAVVSGPFEATGLAVTSYTSTGTLRWQSSVSPSSGTFVGDWVAAAPNGDFVAVGHTVSGSSGNPIAISLVRFGSDGSIQWRIDVAGTLPGVGRLLVDASGNAYLAFNALGDGQDIQLHKYSPEGALLWSEVVNTGFASNNIATSLALSTDQADVVLTGDTIGGSEWITALYDTATGDRRWLVVAGEGTATRDVVVAADRVYVTGQGNRGIDTFLAVVAYDRATGARLWRTDRRPAGSGGAAGHRIAIAPDGSLVVIGQASLGFLDWYTVALETTGALRWQAVRDGGLNTDEIPAAVLVLPGGTSVVTGKGGPPLPGGFIPGVTAGYSPAGALLWEAFSPLATVWATALPNGDVVATGGYDAYLAAFRPPVTASPDWNQFRSDARHSGWNPSETTLSPANVGALQELWRGSATKGIQSSPAVVDGIAYVGADDGALYAFDTASGSIVWTSVTGGRIVSSPAVVDGAVYVGSGDRSLYAFDALDGSLIWQTATGGTVTASPAVTQGVVYIVSSDRNLYALSALDGQVLLTISMGGKTSASPAVADGVIYIPTDNKGLLAFDATTGTRRWRAALAPVGFSSTPAVVDGVVFLSTVQTVTSEVSVQTLNAIDAVSGASLWSAPLGDQLFPPCNLPSSPAVAEGTVYVGSIDGRVYAFDGASGGTPSWSRVTNGLVCASPAVANGVVYAATKTGGVYALDAGDGTVLWQWLGKRPVLASPAVSDGALYFASQDRNLYAFGLPME